MNDGGSAFPEQVVVDGDGMFRTVSEFGIASGMSLLDWFAGQALSTVDTSNLSYGTVISPRNPWPDVAEDCYNAAAAMLAERERRMKK